jgi:hypothetical protein
MFHTQYVDEIKTDILYSVPPNPLFENSAIYGIMWKSVVETDRPQIYGACAFHARCLRLQTHTLRICNLYCFSSAIMVTRTRLNVTLFVHCMSCCSQEILLLYLTFKRSKTCVLQSCSKTKLNHPPIPSLKLA